MGIDNLRSIYKAGYMEFCEIFINTSFNHLWLHKRNNTIEIRMNKKANRKDLDSLFDFFEYFASNCRKHARNISDVCASETLCSAAYCLISRTLSSYSFKLTIIVNLLAHQSRKTKISRYLHSTVFKVDSRIFLYAKEIMPFIDKHSF